mmetsp:Transcript_15571/g.29372  ORF Transcript_15571/g.29372 Transcript_15571/m.29372 type:complete len:97 (-) Transcript_15571:154-444(-)
MVNYTAFEVPTAIPFFLHGKNVEWRYDADESSNNVTGGFSYYETTIYFAIKFQCSGSIFFSTSSGRYTEIDVVVHDCHGYRSALLFSLIICHEDVH